VKVILLDRDGTIIQDPEDLRVDSKDEIELFDDSIAALRLLAENNFVAIIITNQAGIGEGRYTEAEFWDIHNEALRQLSPSGITFLKTYFNGESGDAKSNWRKPGPNMLLQAAKDFNFDLSNVYMVGDNESDILAAKNAGCAGGILVKTARNKAVHAPDAIYEANTLTDAVKYIIENTPS
jgi:histidinol-phosphate phosphatase family protein